VGSDQIKRHAFRESNLGAFFFSRCVFHFLRLVWRAKPRRRKPLGGCLCIATETYCYYKERGSYQSGIKGLDDQGWAFGFTRQFGSVFSGY
jgi:hypothetical protein